MREELEAVLLPGIDSTGVVSVDAACVAVQAWATVSARSSASGGSSGQGPSAWIKHIGLVSDEADVYSALRDLKLIYVPYGHTYGPAKGKDHTREEVGGSDLECPLMHECLEKPCEVHLESSYHHRLQHCSIPGHDVISSCGGKAVMDEQPQQLCYECPVGLLDGPLRLSDQIGTLSIY